MKDVQRCKGRFRLPTNTVRDVFSMARQVMAKCVIVRCDHLWIDNAFEYWALSPLFDEVEPGEITPFYDVRFSGNEIKFVREK